MSHLITEAAEFAKKIHHGQYRKFSGRPYFVHPEAVAATVASVTQDSTVIAAAYLHDVIEDTTITSAEIHDRFGGSVGCLVDQLTDVSTPADGSRAIRKALDRNHTAAACAAAKTIRLADILDNLPDMILNNPDFAPIYAAEKCALMNVLKTGHPRLYRQAAVIIADFFGDPRSLVSSPQVSPALTFGYAA